MGGRGTKRVLGKHIATSERYIRKNPGHSPAHGGAIFFVGAGPSALGLTPDTNDRPLIMNTLLATGENS